MSRIEISMEEYQGKKAKIKNLENALNSVSKEAAANKETIEKIKALVSDLENETWINRLCSWKKLIKPFKDILENGGKEK